MRETTFRFPSAMLASIIITLFLITDLHGQKFSILFTGSANGTIENCLCPDLPLGGLEKRAQFVETYRKKHPDVLLLDTGDNFIDYLPQEVSDIVTTAFVLTDFDLISLGDQDIAYGTEDYLKLDALISELAEPVLINKGGINFSILPILHKKTTRFHREGTFDNYDLDDLDGKISAWLKKDAPANTLHILLSHSGYDSDRQLAEKFPQIDLIIGGHSQTVIDKISKSDSVPIVHAGANAGYIGELRYRLRRGKFSILEYTLHPMTLALPDHPDIIRLIDKLGRSH